MYTCIWVVYVNIYIFIYIHIYMYNDAYCHIGIHCITSQRTKMWRYTCQRGVLSHCNTLQHTIAHYTAPHCNTLQHTAAPCNTQRRDAARINEGCCHIATHYTTLYHTAIPCNTPKIDAGRIKEGCGWQRRCRAAGGRACQ